MNIVGIHQADIFKELSTLLSLHPLVIEDIMNNDQRPKMVDYEDYFYVVLKMLHSIDESDEIVAEQISLIIGPNFVISFQEKESNIFSPIKKRISNNRGRIRKMGADYLAYTLIDVIVDNYFIILEKLEDKIEFLEDEVVENPYQYTLQAIQRLKKEIMFLRKSIWPLREVISSLEKSESPLIQKTTLIYLKDIYDHTIQIIDAIEAFHEAIYGMLHIYLSSISNKMNKVINIVTIIGTIFIPLTFITGIYGMNFKYMPELEWRWGYPIVLFIMFAIGVITLLYFKRRKWL